jgi:hypothetical protein
LIENLNTNEEHISIVSGYSGGFLSVPYWLLFRRRKDKIKNTQFPRGIGGKTLKAGFPSSRKLLFIFSSHSLTEFAIYESPVFD